MGGCIRATSTYGERMIVCKKLKDSVLSVDLVKKTDYQKSCLIGVYWQTLLSHRRDSNVLNHLK